MNSSTTRMLASFFLAMAAVMAGAQTPAQPQVAPHHTVAPQQAAAQQPQTAPQQNAVPQPSTAQPQTSAQQNVSSEGQALHILVGKSVVVNVQAPITRVLSSNPAVIETLATSPTEIVVEGRTAGTSSLILWDQSGRSQMLDVIVDLDVTGLRNAITRAYPKGEVDVQADGGRLVLTGNVPDAKSIEDLTKMATVYSPQVVSSLQVAALHEKQILLEVKFAEVDRSKLQQFGINIFSTGAANTPGTVSTQQFSAPGVQGAVAGTIGQTITGTTSSFQ